MKPLYQRIVGHPFFSTMAPEHQAILVECAGERRYEAGEILFREGEPANQFFLIEEGHVILEGHRPGLHLGPLNAVQELGPGDVLGWSWLFPPFTWHLQARAIEPTSAILLNGAHLLVTAERDTRFGYCLMKRMAQVLIRRLQSTRAQLAEKADACHA